MGRFKTFINREVKNGITRHAVTLRLVTMVQGLYFLVMFVMSALSGWGYAGLISAVDVLCCLWLFQQSYVRSLRAIDFCIDDAMIILAMLSYSYLLGNNIGVMSLMYPQIILIFVLGSYTNVGRYVWIALMILVRVGIFEYQKTASPFYQTTESEYLGLMTLNFSVNCILIILIALVSTRDTVQMEKSLISHNSELRNLASIDPLTGLRNRRSISEYLVTRVAEYQNGKLQGLSVAIGDIDLFKRVNDTYGHDCGDIVLRDLATVFRTFMLGKGSVGRWGGEEFLFVFSDMNGDVASAQLADIQSIIRKMEFRFGDERLHLTMTFGLSEYDLRQGLDAVIKEADEKLYMGKDSGRNVVIY